MIALLLNHLWQSTLCAGGAGLLALALRRNGAHIRFWLWFTASLKFLVPFAALTALGAFVLAPMVPPVAVPTVRLVEPLAKPFSTPGGVQITSSLTKSSAPPSRAPLPAYTDMAAQPMVPARTAQPAHTPPVRAPLPAFTSFHLDLESLLLTLWAAGFLMLAIRWLVHWLRMRALLRKAVEAQIDVPVAVRFSKSQLEPGLVGIMHPVILLPEGIEQLLSPAEMRAILAHELCHWRRHDNLLIAIHMLVEALFWFFPLVWWLGARLNAERERACDEAVLIGGNDPQVYAEGILKVCRAYLQAPTVCVAGVSGGGLKGRIKTIIENKLILQLGAARRFVLVAIVAAALVLPLALGLMTRPVIRMREKVAPISISTKTAQRSVERAMPRATKTSIASLSTNQVTESSAEKRVRQTNEEAASGSEVSESPHLSRLVRAESLRMAQPDLSRLVSMESLATPVPIAPNDPPPAQPEAKASAATAAAPSDQSGAPNAAQTAAVQTTAARATCALPAVADSVALKPVPGSDLVTVPVEISGKSKLFLLDISTNAAEVSQATVNDLGLLETSKGSQAIQYNIAGLPSGILQMNAPVYDIKGSTHRGTRQTRVSIRSFTLGRATGHDLQLIVSKDAEMGRSKPYDGLLTNGFFSQYDVELDFGGKKISYLTATNCTDPNQVAYWAHGAVAVVPMAVSNGKLHVPVTIQGHTIDAVIDTSSAHSVMRRSVAEQVLGLKPDTPDMIPDGDRVDGMGVRVYKHTFRRISFEGVIADSVPALIQTNSMIPQLNRQSSIISRFAKLNAGSRIPNLTIGMDVLSQLHLYIAFRQHRLYATTAE